MAPPSFQVLILVAAHWVRDKVLPRAAEPAAHAGAEVDQRQLGTHRNVESLLVALLLVLSLMNCSLCLFNKDILSCFYLTLVLV